MCQFVSTIKVKDQHFYLTKDDLKGRKFAEYKKENPLWCDDIMGHGAIEWFYPELKGKGGHWECDDFSTPDNFPECVVEDIKNGNFKGIGVCPDILNEKGRKEYLKIANSAWKEYRKIQQSAWKEYRKIEQSAWKEYLKIANSAWKEYRKIEQSAKEEYLKIEQSAFWKLAVQKKYRNDNWK